MLVRIINKDGFFLEDAFTEELTEFTIPTPCPSGFYLPRWNGTEWVEGRTTEELAVIEAEKQAVIQLDTNKKTIEEFLALALTKNKDYLAILAPTASDKEAQIKQLTKQMNRVMRLLLNKLDAVE